jgi:hypothetical protein
MRANNKDKINYPNKKPEKRARELQCFYEIALIVQTPGISLNEIYQKIVDLIPQSSEQPEMTFARLPVSGLEFRTNNYRPALRTCSSAIIIHGEKAGTLSVEYMEIAPDTDEKPDYSEEQQFISIIADRLGKVTERIRAEKQLHP